MELTPKAIRCPQCGSLVTLALGPGGKGPRSLRCSQCEGLDPLKAGEIVGWLKGELRPPK
jgi:phage FluMu protein Com